ncbi:MAG: hypothetical protein JWO23_387 [Solirubrobacterales bacterium]|nr:hypothetical protein [Solirubrobacterales bacterium]
MPIFVRIVVRTAGRVRIAKALRRACTLAVVACAVAPAAQAIGDSPVASFLWFPVSPHPGEPVSLASTSTDAGSPITAYAWDLANSGAFAEGGPVMSTAFSNPGAHTVRLRVTGADGLSSIAVETIQVSAPQAGVLLPFPIVRIVGAESNSGMKLRLLSVEAPPGAGITVACHGRGCPTRLESRIATATSVGTVTVRFRRFERALPAGVVLEIRVAKAGQIGKYTRLVVRRHRPPARLDGCLPPAGTVPTQCPSYAMEG